MLTLWMQDALALQEHSTQLAEQEARRNRTQADELRVRCQSQEERCSALYGEVIFLKEDLARARTELQQLRDDGVSLHDRNTVLNALTNTFRGCALVLTLPNCCTVKILCNIVMLAWRSEQHFTLCQVVLDHV
jgi:chromosome segregation ATPase